MVAMLENETRQAGGKLKETAGAATSDRSLQGEGMIDQISAQAQKTMDTAKDALANGGGPLIGKAKQFAKDRPFAAAALAGVIGMALLNTLRGKR